MVVCVEAQVGVVAVDHLTVAGGDAVGADTPATANPVRESGWVGGGSRRSRPAKARPCPPGAWPSLAASGGWAPRPQGTEKGKAENNSQEGI